VEENLVVGKGFGAEMEASEGKLGVSAKEEELVG